MSSPPASIDADTAAPEAGNQQRAELSLDRRQLGRLAHAVAVAVTDALAEAQGVGRSSYSIAEVASRAGFSEGFVREAVRHGLLRVVRPGGRDLARVLPEDEALWLTGRREEDDEPAVGLSKKVVTRNRVRAIVANVMRQDRRSL